MTDFPSQSAGKIQLSWDEANFQIAPGSSLTMMLSITNLSEEGNYFQISFMGIPGNWVAIDKPVVQLDSGSQVEVALTISVPKPPEVRAGRYPIVVQAVSQADPSVKATLDGELTVAAFQSEGRIGVLLAATQFSVTPGESTTIPILLQNRGLTADTFRLGVEGLPTVWISTADAQTRLEPGEEKAIELKIQPPHNAESGAGRRPFKLQVNSQAAPDQQSVVECTLTIAVFSEFSSHLDPTEVEADQLARLLVNNKGNLPEVYSLELTSPEDNLAFERIQRETVPASSGGEPQTRISYTPISEPQNLRVQPGKTDALEFRARPRSRPFLGGEFRLPFTVRVQSSSAGAVAHDGELLGKAVIPVWLAALVGVALVSLVCLFLYLLNSNRNQSASATQTAQANIGQIVGATQTAIYNMTQAAIIGQEDTDGDGLINSVEIEIGTDPLNPDTDRDELLDGEEVNSLGTNPLNSDTDGDGLSDGEEVIRRSTDPLNPDTDGDRLNDGDEVQRATDPLNPDTDRDGLRDGDEVTLGTDPLNPDTDNDQLLDGQESPPCPDPLNPDSDGDGIIDGQDLDPCDPLNPSLTQTAEASRPTETGVAPTEAATPTSEPNETPAPPEPPTLSGTILFESNRDGNLEIYSMNTSDQSVNRLTNNSFADFQPALAPEALLVAYVSNQENNNEIFLTGVDRRAPINLTNHPADDQFPAWSPDGQWIAFTTNRDGNQEIYIMRSDGSELRNLTNNPGNDFAPSWFRSRGLLGGEEWIAFTSDRDGNQEIFLIKPDGSDLRNVSNHPANDYTPSGSNVSDQIVFVSERDGNPEIYRMNLDGSSPTNLTNNAARDISPFSGPTSDWVAFASERDGNLEVYVIRTNGEGAYNLTQNPAQDSNPSWR